MEGCEYILVKEFESLISSTSQLKLLISDEVSQLNKHTDAVLSRPWDKAGLAWAKTV